MKRKEEGSQELRVKSLEPERKTGNEKSPGVSGLLTLDS
jgi:hypothetical protein